MIFYCMWNTFLFPRLSSDTPSHLLAGCLKSERRLGESGKGAYATLKPKWTNLFEASSSDSCDSNAFSVAVQKPNGPLPQ